MTLSAAVALSPLVRHRFRPDALRARALLEAVSEVEPVEETALPPAVLAAHALAALGARAPGLAAERVTIAVRGLAHAGLGTRVAGRTERTGRPGHAGEARARACLRVSQPAGPVLEVSVAGKVAGPALVPAPPALPGELALFARALDEDEERYRELGAWPVEHTVALAAAGVEAEEQEGLARLLRLTVELASPAPLESRPRFALDGVKPLAGDLARIVFRVIAEERGPRGHARHARLVARGDAVVASLLARGAAVALRRAA